MQKSCKRAFVIGLDGAMGWTMREASTPHIDTILSEGDQLRVEISYCIR